MKKLALLTACLAMCALLGGCVEKKEFDAQALSTAPAQDAGTAAETVPPPDAGAESPAAAPESSDTGSAPPAAAPEDGSSPAQEAENLFPWRGYTMNVRSVTDDGSVTDANYTPEGKLVQLQVECVDGVMSWDTISGGYTDFTLRDAEGASYAAVSTGFQVEEGASLDIRDLENNEFVALSPTFDVPVNADLSGFVLYVATETDGESILIALKDVTILQ